MGYRSAAALCAAFLLAAAPLAAPAQGTATNVGGLRVAAGQPVEITAEQAQVDLTAGVGTFSGNVLIVQGDMRLTAPEVRADIEAGADGRRRIVRVHASGGVVLASPTEAAEGRDAVYDVDAGEVVMTGDVALTQGRNVITGERLVVQLADGSAVMEGRVRTLFDAGGSNATGGATPQGAAPEAAR